MLRESNITFFEEKFPEIAMQIKAIEESLSSVVCSEEGEPLDIDLGGKGRLYKAGETARLYSEKQAEDYSRHFRVIMLNRPVGTGGTIEVSDRYNIFMGKTLVDAKVTGLSMVPVAPSGYMMIFGVGLGFHLEKILEWSSKFTEAVVIIEPFIEFLNHSLDYIDWKALGERLDEEGRKLKIFVDSSPKVIKDKLYEMIRDKGATTLDGTYVYNHYFSWIFDEVITHFSSEAYSEFIVRGFFEDEVKMITNSTRNFLYRDFRLLEGRIRQKRKEPFFVIGSGPSLDKTIETVRKWKDHAVIFSGGTALRVLLSNGIRPDFHCELENGETTYTALESVDREFGLKGIKLISSCTIDPKAAELFDEVYLYFRDSVSSTKIFAEDGGYRYIEGTAPTCTNTALATAAMLGFREAYFFGLDCGMRDPARHHSTASVYYTHDTFSSMQLQYPIEIPGNFGGKIYTDWVYNMTRHMIGDMGTTYGLTMINCSDGGLIKNATPKAARSVKFSDKIDKEAVFDSIRSGSRMFEHGSFFQSYERNYRDYLDAFDEFSEELETWLEELPEKCKTVNAFFHETRRFTADVIKRYLAVSELVAASIHNLPLTAQFYVLRIVDEEKREQIFQWALEEYTRLVREIVDAGRALFVKMTEEVEAAST